MADGVCRLLEDQPLRQSAQARARDRAAASYGLARREAALRQVLDALLRGEDVDALARGLPVE